VDLENFQTNVTPVLQAELNQPERCGARLTVKRAVLTPTALVRSHCLHSL